MIGRSMRDAPSSDGTDRGRPCLKSRNRAASRLILYMYNLQSISPPMNFLTKGMNFFTKGVPTLCHLDGRG
jgi:hypothetical protein